MLPGGRFLCFVLQNKSEKANDVYVVERRRGYGAPPECQSPRGAFLATRLLARAIGLPNSNSFVFSKQFARSLPGCTAASPDHCVACVLLQEGYPPCLRIALMLKYLASEFDTLLNFRRNKMEIASVYAAIHFVPTFRPHIPSPPWRH